MVDFFKKLTLSLAPAFLCILLSTLLATMVEENIFKWIVFIFLWISKHTS